MSAALWERRRLDVQIVRRAARDLAGGCSGGGFGEGVFVANAAELAGGFCGKEFFSATARTAGVPRDTRAAHVRRPRGTRSYAWDGRGQRTRVTSRGEGLRPRRHVPCADGSWWRRGPSGWTSGVTRGRNSEETFVTYYVTKGEVRNAARCRQVRAAKRKNGMRSSQVNMPAQAVRRNQMGSAWAREASGGGTGGVSE